MNWSTSSGSSACPCRVANPAGRVRWDLAQPPGRLALGFAAALLRTWLSCCRRRRRRRACATQGALLSCLQYRLIDPMRSLRAAIDLRDRPILQLATAFRHHHSPAAVTLFTSGSTGAPSSRIETLGGAVAGAVALRNRPPLAAVGSVVSGRCRCSTCGDRVDGDAAAAAAAARSTRARRRRRPTLPRRAAERRRAAGGCCCTCRRASRRKLPMPALAGVLPPRRVRSRIAQGVRGAGGRAGAPDLRLDGNGRGRDDGLLEADALRSAPGSGAQGAVRPHRIAVGHVGALLVMLQDAKRISPQCASCWATGGQLVKNLRFLGDFRLRRSVPGVAVDELVEGVLREHFRMAATVAESTSCAFASDCRRTSPSASTTSNPGAELLSPSERWRKIADGRLASRVTG